MNMMSNIIRFSKRKGLLSMQNYVITITRQFGSRGRDIGIATAKKLGIPLYDRNVLEKEAEEIDSTLHSLVEFSKNGMSSSGYYKMAYPLGIGSSLKKDRMFEVQSKLVLQHAETENCVIIGRCASAILRGAGEHPLSVFIYADPADRTRRIAARNGLDERRAMHRAQKIDRMRKHHFDFYADTLWGEPASYDLMLSSSEYGITGAAEVIAAAARAGK